MSAKKSGQELYDELIKIVSGNLSKMINQQGITQNELAKRSGVSPKTVSSAVNGKDVDLKSLCCLQAGLGCDFPELFCEDGKAENKISISINPDRRSTKDKTRELMEYVRRLYEEE